LLKKEDYIFDIKKVQQQQLKILLEFDRICNKNNIKYQLFGGTLLGAIRHKGFIPWDDDIDVALKREDYDKFIKVSKKQLNSNYFLQTNQTDSDYIMQFAKIRKNNTVFVEESTSETDIHHGIYIDIFPLDNVLPNTLIGNLQQKSLYLLSLINLSRIKMHCLNANTFFRKYTSLILHYFLKLVPKKITNSLQTKIMTIFNNRHTEYLGHLSNGARKRTYERFMMPTTFFEDSINAEFEDNFFPIPEAYDEVLTNIYDNYMKMPPKDQRKPHHGVIEVKFNTKDITTEENY